ncbi:MAG: gliding motility-associated C-terminal domain-containing protein [Bacteroidia bacterium]
MNRLTGFLFLFLLPFLLPAQQVVTVAGLAGVAGTGDGTGTSARFNEPHAVVADKNGNIYIADRLNNKIRKTEPNGTVSTFAGTGVAGSTDGPGNTATFNQPWGIAIDTLGYLYVADNRSYKIRKIDPAGNVTTIAGTGVFGTTNGPVNTASFSSPAGIAVTKDGQTIYISEYNTHVIRRISGGTVSVVAGTVYITGSTDGTGTAASFDHPYGITLLSNGNLVIADEWNCKLRQMTPAGVVSTLAGTGTPGSADGAAASASFNYPASVTADTLGNIFVADALNSTIRKFSTLSGQVSTYAGTAGLTGSTDGTGAAARFNHPSGVAYNRARRNIYVADLDNHLLRKITMVSPTALTLAVAGSASVCAGNPATFTITPSGLSGYTLIENGITLGTSVNGTITVNNLSAGAHTFTAIAFDAQGATAFSNNINVTVYPSFTPTVSSSGGTAICNGQSLTLTAQAGTAYAWSNGATTPAITVTTAGAFSVTVTNSNGCTGTSSAINITVQTSPVATITVASDTVCPGKTTTLTAAAANAYAWSNGATTQSITAGAGNYSVTVTGPGGCTASTTQTIASYSVTAPVISPSGSITILQGDSVQLQATGSGTFAWSNGATTTAIWVHSGGTYTVTTTSAQGCTSTSTGVTVTLVSSANMFSALGATSFCDGGSVILSSAFSSGNQWYFEGTPITGATGNQYTVTDSGWYALSVYINGTWLHSDSVLVRVYQNPDVPIANDTAACKGDKVLLSVVQEPGLTYKWYDDFASGTLLGSGPALLTPVLTAPTTYYVEARNANGCISPARMDVDVAVLSVPVPAFTYSVNSQNGTYTATFNCTSLNPESVLWIFGDTAVAGNMSSLLQPEFTYASEGNYTVVLITYNAFGCADTLYKTLFIGVERNLFVPTTFTPNGDGKNDLFRVRGDNIITEDMRIYDQWGTLVYSTNSAKPEWDGTVNGSTVQNGTYFYRIRITDKNQTLKEITGPITVIK